jgi:hypothetical protein
MAQGLVRLPEIRDYWSREDIFQNEFFRVNFSRDRFEEILRNLHLVDNTQRPENRPLFKIEPMLEIVNKAFVRHWKPSERVTVDEAMVAFTGRIGFLQYCRDKPTKWGFKMWKLCDATSYLYQFHIYTGAANVRKSHNGLGYDVVRNLLSFLPQNQSHHLFIDNFYTSLQLVEDLLEDNIFVTGTTKPGRKGFPRQVSGAELENQGDLAWRMKQPGILAMRWLDTKAVHLLSSAHGPRTARRSRRQKGEPNGRRERDCPDAIADYTAGMGAVDRHDQHMSYYSIDRRRYKWWQILFFYILDCSVVNAWIIHREYQQGRGISDPGQKQFRLRLISALTRPIQGITRNPVPRRDDGVVLMNQHWPVPQHQRSTTGCVCGCKRRPSYRCIACNAPLAIECWVTYHSQAL